MQDPLLGMLHQVLTGKSFELILAVATVQGQLRTLVTRLIRFNECSKSGGDKARAQLFDISFLMLVAIVQNYGAGAVLDPDGESLFEQWVRSCMVERQRPKAPEQLLRLGDPLTIEMLLQQFNAGETDFKPNVKWQDVLFNMAGVMHEVLVAWEQGALVGPKSHLLDIENLQSVKQVSNFDVCQFATGHCGRQTNSRRRPRPHVLPPVGGRRLAVRVHANRPPGESAQTGEHGSAAAGAPCGRRGQSARAVATHV
jgi:hypothetical protein